MVEYHNNTKTTLIYHDDNNEEICTEVWSKDLVPGDVFLVPSGGMQLPCDAVLISG